MTVNDPYKLVVTTPSDTEIQMERTFDAPRALVYRAMTERDLISQWWGQRNSTTTVDTLELRVGGKWRFIQRDASGAEHAFRGEFLEISPPDRLVWTFEYEPMPGHIVTDAVTFSELDSGKTQDLVRSTFASKEDRDGMIAAGMEGGAAESYDRLAELLETLK